MSATKHILFVVTLSSYNFDSATQDFFVWAEDAAAALESAIQQESGNFHGDKEQYIAYLREKNTTETSHIRQYADVLGHGLQTLLSGPQGTISSADQRDLKKMLVLLDKHRSK